TLRQDLQLSPGPSDPDGSPTYNIYDPVRASYFKISWAEATIFENLKPNTTLKDLAKALKKNSTLNVSEEGLKAFLSDAERLGLLSVSRVSEDLVKEAESHRQGWFMWLIMHYLYIQIPLFHPDNFLKRTLSIIKPLYSPAAFILYAFILLSGFTVLISRFGEYIHTFTYFFNLKGLIAYAVAISLVKVIHEFAHAFTAKYFGIRVRTMGVAFIVFWPVLFTDVTDSWKLKSRKDRFIISFAGIAAELIIASLSTWGWVLTDPGIANSIFFVISSVTWISTLIVNLNPSMRFDGYYLLCDLWGVDNLQWRAFAYTRWFYRKWLLGIDMPMPEPLSPRRQAGFLVYSIVTWAWRLSLYIFVALFVYYKFTKTLGILLFLLEIGVFILWPLYTEACQVWKLKSLIKLNKRLITSAFVLTLLFLYVSIPLPHTNSFVAVTTPLVEQPVYTPSNGVIERLYMKKNEKVNKGDPLVQLSSRDLEARIAMAKNEMEIKKRQMLLSQLDPIEKAHFRALSEDYKKIASELNALIAAKNNMTIYADREGIVYNLEDNLREGQDVKKDALIAKIAPMDETALIAFIPEDKLEGLKPGEKVTFYSKDYTNHFEGIIKSISFSHDAYLDYPQLASTYSGDLPVKQEGDKYLLIESYYQAKIQLEEDPRFKFGLSGYLEVTSPPSSYLMSAYRYLQKILIRESSL
ncbi:MAG: efflux RND transporter periplasmic adaptor subunit, partial [Parachlamydiaceae bacterium]